MLLSTIVKRKRRLDKAYHDKHVIPKLAIEK